MAKRLDPRWFPNYEDRKVVDNTMEELDLNGVSRRKFLQFASMSALAAASAMSLGRPGIAVASQDSKIAFLVMTFQLEYDVNADAGAHQSAKEMGLNITSVDGQLDATRQLNQFEQQMARGVEGVMLHAPGGGSVKRIAELANDNKVWLDNTWGTLPWFTPFDAGEYYTLYAVPEEFSAHRAVTVELCEKIMQEFGGGNIVGVTGVQGNSTDLIRSRGRDDALKEYPEINLVDELPGRWNREDSQRAMEDLLSRHPNIVGCVAQNDDVADGVIAAMRTRGLTAGQDIYVVGADGTTNGAERIKKGQLLATSANVPQFMGGLLSTRLYDVMNGWKPRAAERMMNWRSVTMTADNVDVYLSRYVNNEGVLPFDYRKMSKIEHPNDWDPQAEVFPMDIDLEWGGIDKPDGWDYPAEYIRSRENGEAETVRQEYADHYKIPLFGASPMKT